MKTFIIIISLFCGFLSFSQPVYHNIRKDKYIKPIINPTHDSIITNLHKYVNICRSDVVKTSQKINLDLSEYPKSLSPLHRDTILDKEAQKRCSEYVEFLINHNFFMHMYTCGYGELLTGGNDLDNLEEMDKDLLIIKKHNVSNKTINYFENCILSKKNPYITVDNLLYEDGSKKVVTGHRDALLMNDSKNEHRIGLGYIKHHYVINENGKEIKKYTEFLVVIIMHMNDINNSIKCEPNKFYTIVNDDKNVKKGYREALKEKDLEIYTKMINNK